MLLAPRTNHQTRRDDTQPAAVISGQLLDLPGIPDAPDGRHDAFVNATEVVVADISTHDERPVYQEKAAELGLDAVIGISRRVGHRTALNVYSNAAARAAAWGSVLVDGGDPHSVADGVARSLTVDPGEASRMAASWARAVRSWTSDHWANSFLELLGSTDPETGDAAHGGSGDAHRQHRVRS